MSAKSDFVVVVCELRVCLEELCVKDVMSSSFSIFKELNSLDYFFFFFSFLGGPLC